MAQEFKLPDLGEGIESGDVVQVHVSEGDVIKAEQTVLEVETDKAVLEVPCPFGGKVSKVHVKQGDKVQVGATLISVESDGTTAGGKDSGEKSKKSSAKEEKKETKKSGKAESKKEDEKESEDEAPSSEVASEEQPSDEGEAEPTPEDEPAEEEKPAASRPQRKPPAEPAKDKSKDKDSDAAIPAGPATRRLARELGVELEDVAAEYPGERLSEQHVKDFVKSGKSGAAEAAAPQKKTVAPQAAHAKAAAPALPDFSQWGEIEKVAFSSLQRKTADHLHHSWVTAPHVTQFDEADIGGLETLRKRYRQRDESKDIKLTVTAFVLKAVAVALKAFPEFNSTLDADNGQLILKKYYHIGLAVDTEAGLIVPVLRDVDQKRVLQLAQEMNAIAERTRQRKIELSELRGGTFTVTNLGGIGGTAFTPIINYPEVAILGVSRGREVPAIVDGQLRSKPMLPLSLSYDHRVINGADGARFLRKVCELLEDPELLLLEG